MAEEIKQGRISDLTFDDKNFNRHTDEGKAMLRKSVDRFGFGRSILVDKNDRIIGGNGVAEVSEDADTIIVETTGDKLVVVKRTDVDLDSKQGREMALADNATAAADLAWDTSAIADAAQEWGIDTNEWGVQAGMPEELAGLDLVPDELQQQQGDDNTEMKRVIICYYPDQEALVKGMLGLEAIDKVVYTASELAARVNQ